MMNYTVIDNSNYVRRGDGVVIPDDQSNYDWQVYQTWLEAGNTPSPAPGPTKANLIAYTTAARDKILVAGIVVNVAASGHPTISIHCDGLPQTRHDLNGFCAWGLDQVARGLTEKRDWFDNGWNKYTLTGAQCVALAVPVGTWSDKVFGAAQSLIEQINSGAITTLAQIDAATWPTS
ncbi:hypothetical protein MJC1_01900 [Methylocystis sp. MJC1]|nr:hypothetical protein [Methylocystis sp. MJC1]KAF2991167.1 hypothetical protein MJC1_01900 [Methylocystis sp. MJC1]